MTRRRVVQWAMASVAALSAIGAEAARPADLSRVGTRLCDIRLDGPIGPGDAARLRDELSGPGGGDGTSLCLSSPGGSVAEAIELARTIWATNRTVHTVVEPGKGCFSACALVFMSGRRAGGSPTPSRFLSASASLGFHAPALRPGEQVDPAQLAATHEQAIKTMTTLITMSDEAFFPTDLFVEMLVRGPGDFLRVETVDQAGRWRIQLIGYRPPEPLNRYRLRRACLNDEAWNQDWTDTEPPGRDLAPIRFTSGRHRSMFENLGDEAMQVCLVDLVKRAEGPPVMKVSWNLDDGKPDEALRRFFDEASSAPKRFQVVGAPLWWTYGPKTSLREIAE